MKDNLQYLQYQCEHQLGQETQAPLVPVSREQELPLTFAQERLWFLEQQEPGSLYNIPAAIRLTGPINVVALQQSFQEIVRRHESLRTVFVSRKGQPKQVILEYIPWNIPVIDLRDLPDDRRGEQAEKLIREEVQSSFDITSESLLSCLILQIAEEEYVFVLTMHRIISDDWSIRVLLREITNTYQTIVDRKEIHLPSLEIQYADFAYWQREWMQGDALEDQLSYWKKQLGGELPVLQLPTDYLRPALRSTRGANQTIILSKPLLESLRRLSQQNGVTLFMTLLATFQTLLHRYSHQEDILVGTLIAYRTRTKLEPLIGFLMNTLVLRINLSKELSFRELLKRVQNVANEGYANQDVPFERLVEELQPRQDLSYTPLFQVMFNLQTDSFQEVELGDIKISPIELGNGTAKFDLTLSMLESENGLYTTMEYNTDLFEEDTIQRMLRNLETLLESVVSDPDKQLGQLEMMSPEERETVLVEWNRTERKYPQKLCMHQLFEKQVERTPNAIALVVNEQRLTYKELHERSNQLAHRIQQLGVGPEVPVGICMHRSAELVVGMLATLKAGGSYVPLDPYYPKDRIAFMLEDTQALLLLTESELVSELPAHQAQVLCLDTDWASISKESLTNLVSNVQDNHFAYFIYTSGSTGKPKGVSIEHRNAVTFIHWALEVFTPEELQGVLFATSICFDLSIFELFVTLSCGGKVIVAENALHLLTLPAREEVTLINTVPSAIAELLRMETIPSSVSTVNLAGEPLKRIIVDRLYRIPTIEKVYNLYGPSEDTTYSTFAFMERESDKEPNIGRPIAKTQVFLLDSAMQPVPIGVFGEVHLGGGGLARGYLNRPELTAEKFIPNPFASEEGARLYKTGDIARYLVDGSLEYQGRIDHQVKIRGFRIELGEIDSLLTRHPFVREGIVVVREDVPGDKRVVVYLAMKKDTQTQTLGLESSELRLYFKERLPEYMVPSAFVVLEALPLTPNGKVDRKALPAPVRSQMMDNGQYVAPKTPTEELLVKIWSEVLGLEGIGIYDHFFDQLGGHSLLATQVITRLVAATSVDLTLYDLFSEPTISGLARIVEEKAAEGKRVQIFPLVRASDEDRKALSFAQQRLWFLNQLDPGNPLYNEAFVYQFEGALDLGPLKASLQRIIQRHETLRTTFVVQDNEPVQVIAEATEFDMPVLDLSSLSEEEQREVAMRFVRQEAVRNFDLTQGPLLVITLLKMSDDLHWMMVNIHHIIYDGWSLTLFMNELAVLYEAQVTGKDSNLRDLDIQYADFAAWQRSWLQGEAIRSQEEYWKKKLSDTTSSINLPTDKTRPTTPSNRGTIERMRVPQELLAELKALSNREGATLFITLMAALQALLYRYTDQEDISVGAPIANRSHVETEGLIGFFANSLVLRTQVKGDLTFRKYLGQMRQVALEAYANQDLPFERIVELVKPERNSTHSPLFQVIMVLHNELIHELKFAGLLMKPLEIHTGTAKMDLIISLTEEEGELVGYFEYATDLFEASTIQRMIEHYLNILVSVVQAPETTLAKLPILTESEKQELLNAPANSVLEFRESLTVYELFEQQVQATPDQVALAWDGEELTYQELDQKANQLAHYLQKQGIRVGSCVALVLEHSLELIIGMLGVVKAGATYVPFDPKEPTERLEILLKAAEVALVLTQEEISYDLPETELPVLCLDAQWELLEGEATGSPNVRITNEQPACVMYSTDVAGVRGVSIEHRHLTRLVSTVRERTRFEGGGVWALFHSSSSSFSLWEIWGALLQGGKLVVVPYWMRRSTTDFLDLLQEQTVTVLTLTTAEWKALSVELEEISNTDHSLRHIFIGGEPVPLHLDFWQGSPTQFYRFFGMIETTVMTTLCSADKQNLGRLLSDLYAYVLDQNLQPVPVGVYGELVVSGAGVVRGYQLETERTNGRWISNPFSDSSGGNLLLTGVKVRRLPNGELEYRGFLEDQVIIEGHSVDLREVERLLTEQKSVCAAAVLYRNEEIIGFVLPEDGDIDVEELIDVVRGLLPEYMVPETLTIVEALPFDRNGKLDESALEKLSVRTEGVKPALQTLSPIQEQLFLIWSDVLEVEEFGLQSNFFELGGHSLLATKVMAKVRDRLGVALSVREIFEAPTLHALSKRIEQEASGSVLSEASRILSVDRSNDILVSTPQQRLWLAEQLNPGTALYNVPFGLRLNGDCKPELLHQSILDLLREDEILRTTFISKGENIFQVIRSNLDGMFFLHDLSDMAEVDREVEGRSQVQEAAVQSFDLVNGPLFKAILWKLSEEDYILILLFHHIVTDGTSIALFISELFQRYEGLIAGTPFTFERPSLQYADYAVWQRRQMNVDSYEKNLIYWKKHLTGLQELKLPFDRLRTEPFSEGVEFLRKLEAPLGAQLRAFAQQQGTTLFLTLLSAFQVLLHYYHKQTEIVVGTVVDGRNNVDLEKMRGFFVNTLVLRHDVSGDPSYIELMERSRCVLTDAYSHQDLSFDKLVEELQPERSLTLTPFFQLLFVLNDLSGYQKQLSSLQVSHYPIENRLAKFDIHFNVEHQNDDFYLLITYKPSLFNHSSIERMAYLYEALLEWVIEHPESSLEVLDRQLKEIDKTFMQQKKIQLMEKRRTGLRGFSKAKHNPS